MCNWEIHFKTEGTSINNFINLPQKLKIPPHALKVLLRAKVRVRAVLVCLGLGVAVFIEFLTVASEHFNRPGGGG